MHLFAPHRRSSWGARIWFARCAKNARSNGASLHRQFDARLEMFAAGYTTANRWLREFSIGCGRCPGIWVKSLEKFHQNSKCG